MKTIRWIQNVMVVVAMVMALYLSDGLEVSRKDALSASVILGLVVVLLLGRVWKEVKEAER